MRHSMIETAPAFFGRKCPWAELLSVALLLLCSACASTSPPLSFRGADDNAMNELAIYAMSLADTPYHYGGNSAGQGFDCSGFVRYVFRQSLGWMLPRTSLEMSRIGNPVAPDHLRPGDLVFFDTQKQPYSHVGIYLGDDRFVHAPSSGKAVEMVNMREGYWQHHYDGARRLGTE
ncbi:MAG: C40 family peptidase [Gallionellaceae bacterium]